MIIFTLITNVPPGKVTEQVLKKASRLVSELFDISEQVILVSIKAGVQMVWGTQPGFFALGTLQSTTSVNAESTKKYAPHIFEFVEQHLGIPQSRMYLGFINLGSENIAFDGKLYSTTKWESSPSSSGL